MKRFISAALALLLVSLTLAPLALAEDPDDYTVEPALYMPHTEPIIEGFKITQSDPYKRPTAFSFTAHCDTGLGYNGAYGNTYNTAGTALTAWTLWMNNRLASVLARDAGGIKTATFTGPLYWTNVMPRRSDATADYYVIQVRLAHTAPDGRMSIHNFDFPYKVLKQVGEKCPCGASVVRDANGCVVCVGGDYDSETILDHCDSCGLVYDNTP